MLEVGCGTGAFTKEILKNLCDGDEFHIVELSTEFCERVETHVIAPFRIKHPEITIELHNASIEEAKLEGQFDAIVCGLPFNNFPIELVQHVFAVMFGFLKPSCELAYFEYLGMLKLKRIFGFPKVRKETKLRWLDIESRYTQRNGSQVTVWRNIPSCRVIRLQACV